MRYLWIVLAALGLLLGSGMALAAGITMTPVVGFGGYYRAGTLVPIVLDISNDTGQTIVGEFVVTCEHSNALPGGYRQYVKLPKGTRRREFLYILPREFAREVTIALVERGRTLKAATFKRCQELYPSDRLLVVVGGTGSSLSYVSGQPIATPHAPVPRPWQFNVSNNDANPYGYGGSPTIIAVSPPMPTPGVPPPSGRSLDGKVCLAYTDPELLPDNPEAYASISMLTLMSDITENSKLSLGAMRAIPQWVLGGGHLLISGGGVQARLQAPFYAELLPHAPGRTGFKRIATPGGGMTETAPYGLGRTTLLPYDPDAVTFRDWRDASAFFGWLTARQDRVPVALRVNDAIDQAITVRNLRPPSLRLIVIYLLAYLLILVPVNYLVLRKFDKRELAWLTTPIIVLAFTFGAYGIGYMTKGHQLIINACTFIETAPGATRATGVTKTLIFSPARATYDLDLGTRGLLLGEDVHDRESHSGSSGAIGPLPIVVANGVVSVKDVRINMWTFRAFVNASTYDLGQGITANVTPGKPASSPRAKGTITNKTPYRFDLCELYVDGAHAASFTLDRGQTVRVEAAGGTAPKITLPKESQMNLETLRSRVKDELSSNGALSRGMVLIGYTDDARTSLRIDGQPPTSEMTTVITRL